MRKVMGMLGVSTAGLHEHMKACPPRASPSADTVSATRGSSGPYTHVLVNHGFGKGSLR